MKTAEAEVWLSQGMVRINQGGRASKFDKIWVQKYDDLTPINVSSFFYDPLKLKDQNAVTLP